MEIGKPVTRKIIPLLIGKRTVELPFETRAECRDLVREIMLVSAELPDDDIPELVLIDTAIWDVTPREDGAGACRPLAGMRAEPAPEPRTATGNEEPEPLPQRTPGSTAPGDEVYCGLRASADGKLQFCAKAHGHPDAHFTVDGVMIIDLNEPARAERTAAQPMCPEHHPATSAPCARLDGHEPPHRTLNGQEWDDGPEPYHATSGPQCPADDDPWFCTAQRGHGGPDHIAYVKGEAVHRWPVADDYHPSRWLAPARSLVSDATIAHVQAVMDATCADPACPKDYPHDKHAPVTVADKNGAAT